jgi:CRP-like cAMP-binding protein
MSSPRAPEARQRARAGAGGGGVTGRIAAQLLALAREYGGFSPEGGTLIPLPLTQSDLAALAGASRVRVNQAIAFFKGRGCISAGADHRLTVQDAGALARRAR